MDEFQMIKSTLASIKEYVSMRSSFPNESDRNNVIRNFNIQFIGKERKKVISIGHILKKLPMNSTSN
ncbi:hypothetical protein A5842_002591 [Enterococcus faecium]|nr:hypothetical protein A5842_002590 [Enterococcus faecium]OTO57668.1 hypothetical protein A5842_002591 [Enterococcus faecium]